MCAYSPSCNCNCNRPLSRQSKCCGSCASLIFLVQSSMANDKGSSIHLHTCNMATVRIRSEDLEGEEGLPQGPPRGGGGGAPSLRSKDFKGDGDVPPARI